VSGMVLGCSLRSVSSNLPQVSCQSKELISKSGLTANISLETFTGWHNTFLYASLKG